MDNRSKGKGKGKGGKDAGGKGGGKGYDSYAGDYQQPYGQMPYQQMPYMPYQGDPSMMQPMYGAAPYGVQNAYSPVQPMGAWGIQGQGAPSPYGVPGGRPEWETFYDDQGTPYYYHTRTGRTQWECPPELQGPAGKGGPSPKADFDDAQNVFVFHLPNLWKDEDLHAQFSNYGKVISAKVMVEPDKKRSRGFGFVAYGTAREAHEAIAKANGLPIQGKRLKVELKTPQDQTKGKSKGKGKKGGYGGSNFFPNQSGYGKGGKGKGNKGGDYDGGKGKGKGNSPQSGRAGGLGGGSPADGGRPLPNAE